MWELTFVTKSFVMKAKYIFEEEELICKIRSFREKEEIIQCRKCGGADIIWQSPLNGWICRGCKAYSSVRNKMVFEGSHLSLKCWLEAAQLISANQSKINASMLQRKMGLSRYATAHKLFRALQNQITIPNATLEDLIGQLCAAKKSKT